MSGFPALAQEAPLSSPILAPEAPISGPILGPVGPGQPINSPLGPPATLPPQNMAPQNPAAPATPGSPDAGVRVSPEKARAYAVETAIPQRVPVRPDDPHSAMWEVDPRVAFARAQREQRPLLLLFTADWNAKCLKLSEEVFSTKSFNDFVKENVVICYLNFPRNQTDAHPLFRDWKERFGVMGYPNLLVFDPEGHVVREITGYSTGKPVTYFNQLKEIVLPVVAATEERKAGLRKKGFRDWKNREGVPLFAAFVRWGGELLTLRGVNGDNWTVELGALSDEDQTLVRSFPQVGEVK
ncbi:MAG: thioredoxin family protein [Verrucomicrobiae bacterium]|nr:thioredoxin family protein [Verrucomicrobiae bacterium]